MELQRRNSIFYSDDEDGGEKKTKGGERDEKKEEEEEEGGKEEDLEGGYEAMLMEKTQKDERYSRVAVRAKLSVEVEQKKRLGAWGRRVLVLDGATLYAYKVKGEGGSVGGWSVGGADVHVGKSSDDGRHLLVISRPPAYKLTFSFTTTYEQARMIQALSSSGATVTGLEAIMLLKNLRKKQQQEQEEKEEERKRLTMDEGLILQTLPYPEDLLRGGGGGGGGETGRDGHKEEIKTGADKEEEGDQHTEGKGEDGEKVQQVEEREQELEDEEEEISQAVYNYMAFSSMFSNSSVTKESTKREETEDNERKTENEAEEQEEEVNEDERDSREERKSNEGEMNDNDMRNNEEENAVQQNSSYQTTATASQPPHTTPPPSMASGEGAGEGQRVEVRVNPLPKPPRVSQVPEGRPTDSKQTISSASEPQSTPAGQEGSRVVLEQSEDRGEVQNGVLGQGSEEKEALLKGGVKESEDKEILVKKLNEESKGVISDSPTLDLSLLKDRQKEEEERGEQEQRDREKGEENSETKEDKSSHETLQNETVQEVKEDKRKEEDKDTYSQLVTTMRLDRSFTLDTHTQSSAPSSELSSPSDEAVLHSPTSPSSPKSPSVHSPTLDSIKSSDNEDDKKEESWVSDVFSDSEEQFEKLYNELSKTLNQPSQPEDEIYNSNGNTETEESSVVSPEESTENPTIVTPDEPKEESTVVTPEEPKKESTVVTSEESKKESTVVTPEESKEASTVVTPNEPREEITVVPLKESDSTPQNTELKRTNSIIKRRDRDGSQSSTGSNKKVQFDPNVQSIDLPPDPPLHDLPQVKENGEARPGVSLIREKTGKNTTQVKANDNVATKARKIEENKRKTSPGPSSPVRKRPQVSSPVKTTRSVTSGDGVAKKREGSVRTPSPVSPSSPSKTLRKTETEDKKTKKTVSEDKTKKTVNEDKTRKVERKEEIKKVGKDEKTEDKPGKKEEARKVTDKEEKSAMKKTEQEEKAKTKAEDIKKTIDTKTKEEKTQIKIKTEAKDEGRKTTNTITTTTTTTIKQLTSKAVEVKGAGSVSNVKRQSTVDLQAPLVISGQVEMGGNIGGRLNARRVEVRDGHILAFISHASTPSSRLPLAGLSVTPMLGGPGGAGGGAGASLILTRASRCMMVLKLRSREEMMHWIHTLSDEVLRVTPEEHLKGLTLYPSPEQKEERKDEEETNEEREEEEEVEKEGEEDSGGKSTLKDEVEDVTKEEERPKKKEETEEESEVEEREQEENREEPEAEDREVKEESTSDESLKKEELPGTITQRKQEKPVKAEEKSTKDNHSLPSQPQREQEASPKENGEVEKDSPAKKRIITSSPHFMEHLNKFREQQKTEIQVKRAGKDEDEDQTNTEGRKGVNRKTGNKLEETISNKIAALIKEAEGRDREAGRERRESVGGREGRKAGRGAVEERDTKAGTGEAGKEGRRDLIAGREGGSTGKVAEEERDTKAGTEGDGEGTEGSDAGGDIQVEIRKHPGRKNKDEGRTGGLKHPPLRRISGQGKSPSQSPLPSPLASPLKSPRVGEDVVDNYLLLNIMPEKALPTTITTTTTITKATTATTTTTTSTTTTTTPKSVHHTTTATSKRTPPHTTTHHNHSTTTPTNRHANCFKPNDPISSFNRSISASNTSLAHDEGRKAHTETLKRSTSDIEINKGRKEGSLTRKGAVKIKNTGNRTSKHDRERVSEGDVSEAINTAGTTLSSVISSRILAAKNIEIIERKDRKGSESEDTEDKENETWNQEAHKRAMNVSLRKDEERGRGKQEVESNITWSVAATREKFELLCSVSGENKGKLTTKTPISRRRSTRMSQKRRRTQELNSNTPRRQGSVRRSFIATEDDQSNDREGVTRQRSVQSREASIEVEDSTAVAEEKGVEKGAMRRLGGLNNSTTSQDEEYNQGTQKESARRQGSWPTKDTVQEARKAFERYSTRTTTPDTTDKAARHDSGIQKEKLTAKKSPLSRTQNILQGSPMSISESGHEDEEFRSTSPPPFARSSAMQSRNDDVVICWRGPYIAQESEQEVLNNISNAFLAKRRLLNKEVAMGRLQGRLHLLEEHLWGLQARLATEEQVAGGDRKSVERALRSVEEEIDHVTARLSMVQKEAHQAREKLAAALATGLSQWCDKTGISPRSSLTRRAKEHHRQQDEEEEEEEYMEEESEA